MQVEIREDTWLMLHDTEVELEQDHGDCGPVNYVRLSRAEALFLRDKLTEWLEAK